MTTTLRVTDTGVVVPREVLEVLGVRVGDDLQVVATEESVNLKKRSAVVEKQLEVAKRVMEERRDVLRRLAE